MALPINIVSRIKKQKSSPNVFSSLFLISKLLKGIFFFLKTTSVAFFWANIIWLISLFFKYFCSNKTESLFIFAELFSFE